MGGGGGCCSTQQTAVVGVYVALLAVCATGAVLVNARRNRLKCNRQGLEGLEFEPWPGQPDPAPGAAVPQARV